MTTIYTRPMNTSGGAMRQNPGSVIVIRSSADAGKRARRV